MKTLLSLFCAATLAGISTADAQTVTMEEVLRSMPDTILPTLTTNSRLDLIDYAKAGMRAVASDRLDTECVLDTLTSDYLHLTLGKGLEVEMKILPVEVTADSAGYRVCVVRSYGEPAVESSLQFYGSKWQAVPNPFSITSGEWNDPTKGPLMVSLSLSPDSYELTATRHHPMRLKPADGTSLSEETEQKSILLVEGK